MAKEALFPWVSIVDLPLNYPRRPFFSPSPVTYLANSRVCIEDAVLVLKFFLRNQPQLQRLTPLDEREFIKLKKLLAVIYCLINPAFSLSETDDATLEDLEVENLAISIKGCLLSLDNLDQEVFGYLTQIIGSLESLATNIDKQILVLV